MSTNSTRLLYIAQPPLDGDDIIETDVYYDTEPMSSEGDRVLAAFIRHLMPDPAENRHVSPPPNVIPARPGNTTSGTGFTGYSAPTYGGDEETWHSPKPRQFQLGRVIFMLLEDSLGYFFIIRVPKKVIPLALAIVVIMLSGKPENLLDLFLNILF